MQVMMLPYPFLDSYMMFFIYSFIGWVVEVIYCGVVEDKFINRGFLNGPMCPVYGLGFYAAIWFFEPFTGNFFVVFFGTALAATTVELIAGVILFHAFHMRWWDYSDYKLNLRGYICLRFFIYWGIACSLGLYVIHPIVMWLIHHIDYGFEVGLVVFLTVILVIDLITTIATIIGFQKKVWAFAKITSGVKVVSDKLGEQIYGSVDTITTVSEPTLVHYEEYRRFCAENKRAEKELAASHRAEEKAFADQFTAAERESLKLAKDAALEARNSFVHSFKHSEQRLINVLQSGGSYISSAALKRLKSNVSYKETVVFPEIEEKPSGDTDNDNEENSDNEDFGGI